jgi:DNA-binding NarL/FixJ family response regulator
MKPTMLIVDDHPMLLAGLREALADSYRIEYASSPQIAEVMLLSDSFDIVLFDFYLGQTTSLGLMNIVREHQTNTQLCIITQELTDVLVELVAPYHPEAIMEKSLSLADLTRIVADVCAGGQYYDVKVVGLLFSLISGRPPIGRQSASQPRFTQEEKSVLKLTAIGQTAKEIAGQVGLSAASINLMRRDIKNRLGLSSFADLIAYVHTHAREFDDEP